MTSLRFLTFAALSTCALGTLSLAGSALAQELPSPAEPAAPPTPQPKPAQQPVVVITDNAPKTSVPDWMTQPPVRAGQNQQGSVIIVTPNSTPVPLKMSKVGGVSVRGLTDLVALQLLKSTFEPQLATPLILDDGLQKWPVSRVEFGASIPYRSLLAKARATQSDVPVRVEVNLDTTRAALRDIATKMEGAQVAIDGSALRIKAALEASTPQDSAQIIVKHQPTAKSGIEGFPFVLAEFSSRYDASLRGRTQNLRMAAKQVNGTIVEPGETFSTNKAIGPREAEAGWREAQMFVSGQVVSGVGAGICQCASSLYNAALLAGLPIVERHPHMFRVMYVPASRDATIYWGGKDFRFKNNTGGPIYVETFLRDGRFHARLLGTQPRKGTFEVESRVISRKGGTLSEAYRIAKTEGAEVKERLSRDFYKPHP